MKKILTSATFSLLTTMNTLGVSLTYFDSLVNFAWHTRLSDHPLTDCEADWEIYTVAMATVLCVFIGFNNQKVMPDHIAKFVNHLFGKEVFPSSQKEYTSRDAVVDLIACVAKAGISTASLLSSIKDLFDPFFPECQDQTRHCRSWLIAVPLSLVFLVGNVLAVFSVLMEHRRTREGHPWSLGLSTPLAKGIAQYVRICYGLAQGGIYSNAIMNPLVLTHALKNRPAYNSPDLAGKMIFWTSSYFCLEFMWGSGEAMYHRTQKILERRMEEEEKESKPRPGFWQKWRGGVASGFRSMALIAAIFCFFYLLSHGDPWITGIVSLLSVFAAPGVCSLLYPTEEPEEKEMYPLLGNPNILLSGKELLINCDSQSPQSSSGHRFATHGFF